jgi:DNA-directed RNA polymerase III subunit RPC6
MSTTTTTTTTAQTTTDAQKLVLGILGRSPDSSAAQSVFAAEARAHGISPEAVAAAITALLADAQIDMAQRTTVGPGTGSTSGGGELVIRLVPAKQRDALRDATAEERAVFGVIRDAGSRGVWSKDVKGRAQLQASAAARALKGLEAKRLVKWVKPVSAKTKKLYLVHDVEPGREITGGAFYADAELDEDLIDVIRQQCVIDIGSQGYRSARDVHERLRGTGAIAVELSEADIVQVLDTLVYDGAIEPTLHPSGALVYKPARLRLPHSPFSAVPCSRCPVARDCVPFGGGPVCPQTCRYLSDWLGLPSSSSSSPSSSSSTTLQQQ